MTLKRWETALYISLIIAIMLSAKLVSEQRELSNKIIRLHVVANSDTEDDQALKLAVRDRVMAELEPLLSGVVNQETASEIIEANISQITNAATETASELGYSYDISAKLSRESYPTREYETFSLPAGRYDSLRIEIGGGDGKNWWCVVFPPLCSDSPVDARTALAALSDDEIALITEESNSYTIKFRALELLDNFAKLLK